jgi:hypothetical protein
MYRYVSALFVSCLCLALTPLAFAQDAQIQGRVADPSGAVIAKAQVRAVDQQTGIERKTETNASGQYTVPGLTPSLYQIFVQATGFSTAGSSPVTLNVGQNAVLDFTLHVGSSSEVVTVNESDIGVNTTDGSVSTVIDRQFVENLPLNGRSFQSLLYLTPGVAPNVVSASTYYAQGQFIVNGQRGDANYWSVDGVSANVGVALAIPGATVSGSTGATNALGGTNALVSVDALQEFRIETSTYSPEFGRVPGGQIAIQTRPGTNQLHGTVFEYLRNGDLDATDWFADHNGLPKPLEIQNDFGGVLGGPILRDKAFFFFSYEGLRLRLPQTFLGTVPDMASRTAAVPAVAPYLNMYPLPRPGATDACSGCGYVNYSTTYSEPGSADSYSLRLDHQLFENIHLFARYSHAPSSVKQRGADYNAVNTSANTTQVTKTATAGSSWVVSSKAADDFRFNYSVAGGKTFFDSDAFGGGTPFPDANLFPQGLGYQNSVLFLLPTFGTSMREWHGLDASFFQHQYNVVNTFSLQEGSHDLKLGVDYRHLSPELDFAHEQIIPLFDSIPDWAAGSSYTTITELNAPQTFLLNNFSLFGQDTWRLGAHLNLTYGLRWDVDFAPTNARGLGFVALNGYSNSNLANLAAGKAGVAPYATSYWNIAPRIGAAYQLSRNPTWGRVLRGGLGVFYGLASSEIFNVNFNNDYYPLGGVNVFGNVAFPTTPDVAALPVIQAPNLQNQGTLAGFDPHLKLPYALEWNVALEQYLGGSQTVSFSYVGANDKRLLASEFVNNPNSNYASANLTGNGGSSNYEALQAQFRRRLSNGLQAMVSYTWSHSIDNGSYGAYENGSLGEANVNRGDSDYDVRQAVSGALTYNVPTWRSNWFTRAVSGGWSTDNEVQFHSGPPIDITDQNYAAVNTINASVIIRPDRVPGQPLYLTGSQYPGRKSINPAAFQDPPLDPMFGLPARQGTLPRNALRALGLAQWDFDARREFHLFEGVKLQFRAELFNLLNHPNFGPFNNVFQSGNQYFGQATAMLNQALGGAYAGTGSQNPLYTPGGPRSGEFALKLIF